MSAGSLSGATAFWLAAKNVNVEMLQMLGPSRVDDIHRFL